MAAAFPGFPYEFQKQMLYELRQNCRQSIQDLCKNLKMPRKVVTLLLSRLFAGLIRRNTALLDFEAIGFPVHVFFIFRTDNLRLVRSLLESDINVNSAFQSKKGVFLADAYFTCLGSVYDFEEKLAGVGAQDISFFHVTEESVKEAFRA